MVELWFRKAKFHPTKSLLMQDWVFRLGTTYNSTLAWLMRQRCSKNLSVRGGGRVTFLQLWGDDSISDSVIFPWKAGGRSHTNMRVKVHLRFIFKVGIHTYCKVANSSTSHLVVCTSHFDYACIFNKSLWMVIFWFCLWFLWKQEE